jgi:hypothetical protein
MKTLAAKTLVTRLIDWGVDTNFGLPGDASMGASRRFAVTRTSRGSSWFTTRRPPRLMACAYAKTTGKLGVCIATSGPGGVHLLNGLYDAKLDHYSVLAITGMQSGSSAGTGSRRRLRRPRLQPRPDPSGPGGATDSRRQRRRGHGGPRMITSQRTDIPAGIRLVLREFHDSEAEFAFELHVVGERHRTDHEVRHVAVDLARWSLLNRQRLATMSDRSGHELNTDLDAQDSPTLVRRPRRSLAAAPNPDCCCGTCGTCTCLPLATPCW